MPATPSCSSCSRAPPTRCPPTRRARAPRSPDRAAFSSTGPPEMSLNSILSIARSALAMQQRSVDVTSHNIANAGTEGYRRQRLELSAEDPLRTAQGTVGRGVTADGVTRARDQFLDASYRQESSLLGRFDTTNQLLSGVETIFDDSNADGLGERARRPAGRVRRPGQRSVERLRRGLVVQSAQALDPAVPLDRRPSGRRRQRCAAAHAEPSGRRQRSRCADRRPEPSDHRRRQGQEFTRSRGPARSPDRQAQSEDRPSGRGAPRPQRRSRCRGALLVDGAQHSALEVRSPRGRRHGPRREGHRRAYRALERHAQGAQRAELVDTARHPDSARQIRRGRRSRR